MVIGPTPSNDYYYYSYYYYYYDDDDDCGTTMMMMAAQLIEVLTTSKQRVPKELQQIADEVESGKRKIRRG